MKYKEIKYVFSKYFINIKHAHISQFGTPIHEIGHVLGLWHEQQRSDRDEHVEVIWKNVGYLAGQFFKTSTENQDLPYNFGSIMHYGPKVCFPMV